MSLAPGLYDQPLTQRIAADLAELASELLETARIDPSRSAELFSRVFQERLVRVLESVGGENPRDRVERQLALINGLLDQIGEAANGVVEDGDKLHSSAAMLEAILAPTEPPKRPRRPPAPGLPLSESSLLVNGHRDLSVGPEIKKEIQSADRVDLLCSFLKWSGFRLVEDELRALCARRAPGAPSPLRVLTTAYMSATERRALDELEAMGAEVKVSYDTERTRLHAKAWQFHRASGFSTALIGSSNLSHAAMLDGVEWNVRVSQIDNPAILEKFAATFEQYWADRTFAPYDPAQFTQAVKRTRHQQLAPFLKLDVEPRPHQREILDALATERSRGHHRNLVVAATGTGKTIVAALDYERLRATHPRLLFVAHRREILDQSLSTFQVVCKDPSLERLHSGDTPLEYERVFASVQSLHEDRLAEIPPDHFDVLIVDEFHHAAAGTYERLLEHFRPKVLLGLTATPERADGKSILHHFDDRIAYELRLWKALDQDLLSPFQYFGVGGAPDLRADRLWSGGRYKTRELSNIYTADHLFAKRVLQETAAKVTDVHQMRGLGFCVDIAHAEFMAQQFNEHGIAAEAVSANTARTDRAAALRRLEAGDLNILFSVDLFNEGVDLPNVDTLLFLRPTESATVFLQQLGRGLRRARNKACCTVLDFIGGVHRKFRFDARFRALLGGTRKSIQRDIDEGFPRLPSGCSIQLDRVAKETVLENIRQAVGRGRSHLIEDLRALGPGTTLQRFLHEGGYDLEDVYDGRGSFSSLRRQAGFETREATKEDQVIERAFDRMLHIDDFERLDAFTELLAGPDLHADDTDAYQRLLFVLLRGQGGRLDQMQPTWDRLWRHDWLRTELRRLLGVLVDRTRRATLAGAHGPLRIHATYTRFEVMAAFDQRAKSGAVKKIQTGVYPVPERRTDLFFVTLEKSEQGFTATTMYRDYPLSEQRFHWESQSTCHEGTPTGRRYLTLGHGEDTGLLFVRQRQKDDRGVAMPYVNLGPVRYAGHTGARPMQIEWELDEPMPADLYQEAKLAAG